MKNWPQEATTDPNRIRAWARKWPDASVGIATGPSGLLVVDLDFDPAKQLNGIAEWEKLQAQHGPALLTYAVRTRRGGLHLYFTGQGRTTAGELAPGIDTRSVGGYVVAWSVPDGPAPAPAPEWLLQRLAVPARAHVQALPADVMPDSERRPLSLLDLRDFASKHSGDVATDAHHVLNGKPWGVKGARDERLSRLSYALVSAFPWLDPEGTANLFVRACEAIEREDGAETSVSWVAGKLRDKILAVARSEQARLSALCPNWSEDIAAMFNVAANVAANSNAPVAARAPERPVIRISTELHENVDATSAALAR